MEKEDTFDADVLRRIEKMSIIDARNTCIELINTSKTRAKKKAHLLRDINEAPSSKEMSRIMWNVLLSGLGLSTIDSTWQKMYS